MRVFECSIRLYIFEDCYVESKQSEMLDVLSVVCSVDYVVLLVVNLLINNEDFEVIWS